MCRAVSVALLLLVVASQAGAQSDTARREREGWIIGASVGVPGYGRESAPELFTVGVQWTQLRRGRLGADFSLGTMPRLIGEGVVPVALRGGLALPLAVTPDFLVLPSAGASLFGGVGAEGIGGLVGVNGGVATVIWTGPVGFRTGVTWHGFQNFRGSIWLVEVGVVGVTQWWR